MCLTQRFRDRAPEKLRYTVQRKRATWPSGAYPGGNALLLAAHPKLVSEGTESSNHGEGKQSGP